MAKTPIYQDAYRHCLLGTHVATIRKEIDEAYKDAEKSLTSVGANDTGAYYWKCMPVTWNVMYPQVVAQWQRQAYKSFVDMHPSLELGLPDVHNRSLQAPHNDSGYDPAPNANFAQAVTDQHQRDSRRKRDYTKLGWIQSTQ